MTDDFVLRVLHATARDDNHDDLWWRTDGGHAPITFFVKCSDVFASAYADLEPLTPDTIDEFEQAAADVREACGDATYAGDLYCARRRQTRPQGAAYPSDPRLWPLFDACGPERPLGLDNPKRHPAEVTS